MTRSYKRATINVDLYSIGTDSDHWINLYYVLPYTSVKKTDHFPHFPMTSSGNAREVCGLYRKCLRLAFNWVSNRDAHRKLVVSIRHQFDKNRGEADSERAKLLLDATRYILWKYRHPEPYICTVKIMLIDLIDPTAPGGVAYDREPKFPKEVSSFFHLPSPIISS